METNEPAHILRIRDELRRLNEKSNIEAALVRNGSDFVIFRSLQTAGGKKNLPTTTDVIVPVPAGYPASAIDMPALPENSPLIPHVVGGSNPQGTINVLGQNWKILSYHPYNGGGGPPWNPMIHGYHDYYHQLFTWFHQLI